MIAGRHGRPAIAIWTSVNTRRVRFAAALIMPLKI
jgi:hypothetical protein